MTGEVNISPGCYGAREATDIPYEDMFMGIPFAKLCEIFEGLEGLSKKAIIRAREKGVYKSYIR
jgi:uncharacterized protein (DUF169 family)